MKIVIGTESPPKLSAIKDGIEKVHYLNGEEIEIISLSSNSEVSNTPLSLEENMAGAKNRVKNIRNKIEADFYIGMEGGTAIIGKKSYLFGVVYVENKNGDGHFGFSNFVEVPEIVRKRIYENKEDLGKVSSEMSGTAEVNKKSGSFGVWTDEMLTRKEQFLLAFLGAIAPFYNKYYKM